MGNLQRHPLSLSRLASDIISNTTFKKVVKESNCDFFYKKANRYKDFGLEIEPEKNSDFIMQMYSILVESYRSEYLYKNVITDKLTSDKKYLKDANAILNEFKIGKSIADLVFINGKNRVYEIKTELDSPERLKSQVEDYRKMFSEVFIVTHYTLQDKYLKFIKDDPTGLVILNSNLELSVIKEPTVEKTFLDVETIFRTLRRDELLNVIATLTGESPNVPNTLLMERCLDMISLIEKEVIQKVVLSEMKKRIPKQMELLKNERTIKELKHICLCLNFSEEEYYTLYSFLDSKFLN